MKPADRLIVAGLTLLALAAVFALLPPQICPCAAAGAAAVSSSSP